MRCGHGSGSAPAQSTEPRPDPAPPARPHHDLACLAVRPERQHEGLGGALLRRHHRQLDHDEIPAYLEATGERNRVLYQRHGYTDMTPPAIPVTPDIRLHRMWRPARNG